MPEYYTYKNIIAGSTQEKAKNYIGKMVYFADNPNICLLYANTNDGIHRGILRRIEVDSVFPFVIENLYTPWAFVIPCEEEPKPEYIPFSNPDEFIDAYISNLDKRMDIGSIHKLDKFGMWIKYKDDYVLVTYIEQSGINSGTELASDWQDLYDNYTFLDGTPCGKLKEA